jgi:hypothetical protein
LLKEALRGDCWRRSGPPPSAGWGGTLRPKAKAAT